MGGVEGGILASNCMAAEYEASGRRPAIAFRLLGGEGISEEMERGTPLPDPDMLAQEIVDDMQTALDKFSEVVKGLRGQSGHRRLL